MLENAKKTSQMLLDKTSRTFALNIPLLDENKREEVQNQYLFDRVADTIEDSNHSVNDKQSMLRDFVTFLRSEDKPRLYALVLEVHQKTINDHDKVLLEHIGSVASVFNSFDSKTKDLSLFWLDEMCKGMSKYVEKKVVNFSDLNDYCYYVAGTVGRYLTDLVGVKDKFHEFDNDEAVSFGRFLQKVNIIKDFYKDACEGRSFWPSKLFRGQSVGSVLANPKGNLEMLARMVDSAAEEIEPTFSYIQKIPKKLEGYRKFCYLPAVLAMKTLDKLEGNPQVFTHNPVKITKVQLFSSLYRTKWGLFGNKDFERYKQEGYEKTMFNGVGMPDYIPSK